MVLRITSRSVPSTARLSALRRKGFWIALASCSSETIPLLRALVAYPMISSITACGFSSWSKKTMLSFLTAPMRVCMGVVTITAPIVPHRTMMAAVTCDTSLTLPPSITSPPKIPPKARIRPPRLARSGLPPDFLGALGAASAIDVVRSAGLSETLLYVLLSQGALADTGKDGFAKADDPLDHLFRRFEYYYLLACG